MSTASEQATVWKRAQRVVPRGVSSGHRVGWDQVFVRASGAYVWDGEGNRYTDYLNAWGPIVLGHSDSRVNAAVHEAVSTCDLTGVGPQVGETELAERICAVMPSAEKVTFCTSGTDASMHAVHVARAATGRLKILKFHGAYHGWSDHVAVGSARNDLTSSSELATPNSGGLHPAVVADVVVVEWNDREGLERAFAEHGSDIAGAFAEAYVHSFGCVPPAPGFLELLRDLCNSSGTVLVFDEIKTGFRAALGGYQALCGVTPDFTVFGKAVANGFTLAGLAGKESLMSHLGAYDRQSATVDGTYNASPYALAAANATLSIMVEDKIHERLWALGTRMQEGISAAIEETGAEATVVGLGSEWCVYFRKDAPKNFREALDVDVDAYGRYHASLLSQGILEPAFPTGDRRLNAATTQEDIDRTLVAVREALYATKT